MNITTFITGVYPIKLHYQGAVMLAIGCLISCILVFMLLYMLYKNIFESKHDKWRLISDLLIQKAVFLDEEEGENTTIPVTSRAKKLLRSRHFRRLLMQEIMLAKKNISGTSSDNLIKLYKQLRLDKYALSNLKSRFWHIKAKAVQELTVMEMKEYVEQIFSLTNHPNELVRMEAQTAIVQFDGFDGLQFLDTITYPISDWQQIKLLQQLSTAAPTEINIDNWLQSTNSSVVAFALKFARKYNRFEAHDTIIQCLDHTKSQVRLEAIHCLSEIYTEETASELMSRFMKENIKHQVAIVKAFENIGSEDDIPFLVDLLDNKNNEIKINAARALIKIGKSGLNSLNNHVEAVGYPLNEMVMQIKGELAA